MMVVGGSGMSLGKTRTDVPLTAKKKRMPFIAANGIFVLVPAALFLNTKASEGVFDQMFYTVQGIEWVAGALNLVLIGLNMRDGLKMAGRI